MYVCFCFCFAFAFVLILFLLCFFFAFVFPALFVLLLLFDKGAAAESRSSAILTLLPIIRPPYHASVSLSCTCPPGQALRCPRVGPLPRSLGTARRTLYPSSHPVRIRTSPLASPFCPSHTRAVRVSLSSVHSALRV